MPICSYVVLPRASRRDELCQELSRFPECDLLPAGNADLLLLVTTTETLEADRQLRRRIEGLPAIEALLMTFGEIDPDTTVADPLSTGPSGSRRGDPASQRSGPGPERHPSKERGGIDGGS